MDSGEPSSSKSQGDVLNTSHNNLPFPLKYIRLKAYTGYFNGFGVEIRQPEQIVCLSQLGVFGKGSFSRSFPQTVKKQRLPKFIRTRQSKQRQDWYEKFAKNCDNNVEPILDSQGFPFIKKVHSEMKNFYNDVTIIVPDSDSDDDEHYFENLKPECSISKISLKEKFVLSLQESFFLAFGLKCLQIYDLNKVPLTLNDLWKLFVNTEKDFIKKYIVYHHFTTRGFVVKPGIKFGGDFLLYSCGPTISHADYILLIKEVDESIDWTFILGHIRMAGTTAKILLMVEVHSSVESSKLEESPEYLKNCSVRQVLLKRVCL